MVKNGLVIIFLQSYSYIKWWKVQQIYERELLIIRIFKKFNLFTIFKKDNNL
jgi:hypothetical protein